MSGRLGQFDDFIIPEWDVPVYDLPDFSLPDFDVPVDYGFDASLDYGFDASLDYGFDPSLDYGFDAIGTDYVDTGALDMETWIDPTSGESWYLDDASGEWYSADTGQVWTDPVYDTSYTDTYVADAAEYSNSYLDENGTAWYVDDQGNITGTMDSAGNYTQYDSAGNILSQTDAAGNDLTYSDPSTGATMPSAPIPQPAVTNPTTGAPQSFPTQTTSGGFSMPSMKDVGSFLTQAGQIYKMVTGTGAPAPRPGTAGQVPTRVNPQTGRVEYYNAQTRQWQATPPRTTQTQIDPRTGLPIRTPTTTAQLIPGVSNQTLMIGAGVVGLAFILSRNRPARGRR